MADPYSLLERITHLHDPVTTWTALKPSYAGDMLPTVQPARSNTDSTAMASQTSEKPNPTEPVSDILLCFAGWLAWPSAFVMMLGAIWFDLALFLDFLNQLPNTKIEIGCLQWSYWEALSHGFYLWRALFLLGLLMELIFFGGWLCLRTIRKQQIKGVRYPHIVGIRARWFIFCIIFAMCKYNLFTLGAWLLGRSLGQSSFDYAYEKQRRVRGSLPEVETV